MTKSRTGTMLATFSALSSVTGLYIASPSIQATPLAYVRSEFKAKGQNNELKDGTKVEIKFGNGGIGPMFIHDVSLIAKDKNGTQQKYSSFDFCFKNKSDCTLTQSVNFFGPQRSRTFQHTDAAIALATIRPRENPSDEEKWADSVTDEIVAHDVAIAVTYSFYNDNSFPFGFVFSRPFFQRTAIIYLSPSSRSQSEIDKRIPT
jgi:hypothetical protein